MSCCHPAALHAQCPTYTLRVAGAVRVALRCFCRVSQAATCKHLRPARQQPTIEMEFVDTELSSSYSCYQTTAHARGTAFAPWCSRAAAVRACSLCASVALTPCAIHRTTSRTTACARTRFVRRHELSRELWRNGAQRSRKVTQRCSSHVTSSTQTDRTRKQAPLPAMLQSICGRALLPMKCAAQRTSS